ncbi:hypothetical protein Goshw_030342 [Gossypium schwendimanii]|uniref:Uncharacterized protein n=1 Tax=Gossypium schwendimanii TaxID=34291 RepID=A0A7J9ML12_GOSSC|nr:hypothetical protein [Gossypium schwendimanii]
MILCKKIWPLVKYHRWEHFWMIPTDSVVVLLVQEFYASLQDQEFRSTEGNMWESLFVRGKKARGHGYG